MTRSNSSNVSFGLTMSSITGSLLFLILAFMTLRFVLVSFGIMDLEERIMFIDAKYSMFMYLLLTLFSLFTAVGLKKFTRRLSLRGYSGCADGISTGLYLFSIAAAVEFLFATCRIPDSIIYINNVSEYGSWVRLGAQLLYLFAFVLFILSFIKLMGVRFSGILSRIVFPIGLVASVCIVLFYLISCLMTITLAFDIKALGEVFFNSYMAQIPCVVATVGFLFLSITFALLKSAAKLR